MTIEIIIYVLCRNRPSYPIVFTTQGTLVAALFSGTCATCHTIYHHSFVETKTGQHTFYAVHDLSADSSYFQVTSRTVFEVALLNQLTVQLMFSACTFESQAEVYNVVNGQNDLCRLKSFVATFRTSNLALLSDGQDWKLNVTRLEDGWFLYNLVRKFTEDGTIA